MNIVFNLPSFTSRSKEVKRAQDLERRTRQVFPVRSSNYLDTFSMCKNSKNIARRQLEKRVHEKLLDRLTYSRNEVETTANRTGESRLRLYLNAVKKYGVGNCGECADAALAILYANGYTNSKQVKPCYITKFINRETNKVEYTEKCVVDHVCVLCDMNKPDKEFIIDPWLDFADTKENAQRLYLSTKFNKDAKQARHSALCALNRRKNLSFEKIKEKYRIKTTLGFIDADNYYKPEDYEKLGEYVIRNFDNVIV